MISPKKAPMMQMIDLLGDDLSSGTNALSKGLIKYSSLTFVNIRVSSWDSINLLIDFLISACCIKDN